MSLISQSESNVVELSSDEELTTLLTNRLPNPRDRSSSPDTQCSICLDGLTNKCYTNSCFHLFCFECLKRWSISEHFEQSGPCCPLCKKMFSRIFHSFDDKGNHQVYDVHHTPERTSPELIVPRVPPLNRPVANFTVNFYMDFPEIQRYVETNNLDHLANLFGPAYNYIIFNDASRDFIDPSQSPITISGHALRVLAYTHSAWSQPLPGPSSRFRECNSAYFRNNPGAVHRLKLFIIRDLIAIKEIARLFGHRHMVEVLEANITILTNVIIETLTSLDMREGFMSNLLRPYLQWQALHFCHEFYNFASSPYEIPDYDRHVRFTLQARTEAPHNLPPLRREDLLNILSAFAPSTQSPPAIPLENPVRRVIGETIVLDSDNEEPQLPRLEVIVVNSSSDDSDDEIQSDSVRPIESPNSALMNQPSTSTGIRDSLDQPENYRYNLKRGRCYEVDSSSSDED